MGLGKISLSVGKLIRYDNYKVKRVLLTSDEGDIFSSLVLVLSFNSKSVEQAHLMCSLVS